MKETSEEILIIARALYQRDRERLTESFDFLENPVFLSWEMLSEGKRNIYLQQAEKFLAFLLVRDWKISFDDEEEPGIELVLK